MKTRQLPKLCMEDEGQHRKFSRHCNAPGGHEELPRVTTPASTMLHEVRSALEPRSIKEMATYRRVRLPRFQVVPGQPPEGRSQSPGQVPGHWPARPHAVLMLRSRSESAAVAAWALMSTRKRRTAPPTDEAACIGEVGHAARAALSKMSQSKSRRFRSTDHGSRRMHFMYTPRDRHGASSGGALTHCPYAASACRPR